MFLGKLLSNNESSDDLNGSKIKSVVYCSILILIIHTINSAALVSSTKNSCIECISLVYVITGVPVILYLLNFNTLTKWAFCLLFPISVYLFSFYTGVTMGSEIIYLPFLLFTFYFFNGLWERATISFIYILCYVGIVHKINLFNIGLAETEMPDEVIVKNMIFLACFITLFVFCQYFFSTINAYKVSTNQLLNDLKEKNKKLKDVNVELERFNHIASHDLKSPLRNISSFINLIDRDIDRGTSENLKEYISFIKTGTTEMFQLIEDVLKYSKVKDVSERSKEVIDLNELCNHLNKTFNDQIIAKGLPTIYESKLLVKVIFQNLIENGLKYNESEHPTVEITCEDLGSVIQIVFLDNGIGMESCYLEQIFEMFKRLHTKSEYQGTGIGLALVKKITEQLDFGLSVSSVLGQGTEFRLTVPKVVVAESTAPSNVGTLQLIFLGRS